METSGRTVLRLALFAGAIGAIVTGPGTASIQAQAPGTSKAAFQRTKDGKPDLTGVWQALNSAAWDIQDHVAELGVPAGPGVVEGNDIPYLPWAAARRKENYEKRATEDPETKCYLPGVPRATYMGFPFQIVQGTRMIAISYEYAHAARRIYLDGSPHPEEADFWMGESRGRWDGDALVVDVRNFNGQTWFDRAGNFHSDALRVVERYTPVTPHHLQYEATIEDAKVFSRPWKIQMPLYRRMEPNARILEYECVAYLEAKRFGTAGR
jgi:hypothetical protein